MKISSQRVLLLGLSVGTALLFAARTQAETWSFDPSFQRTPLRVTSESASGLKILSSGKVLIHSINGGLLSGANGQRIGALLRIDPNTGAIREVKAAGEIAARRTMSNINSARTSGISGSDAARPNIRAKIGNSHTRNKIDFSHGRKPECIASHDSQAMGNANSTES